MKKNVKTKCKKYLIGAHNFWGDYLELTCDNLEVLVKKYLVHSDRNYFRTHKPFIKSYYAVENKIIVTWGNDSQSTFYYEEIN